MCIDYKLSNDSWPIASNQHYYWSVSRLMGSPISYYFNVLANTCAACIEIQTLSMYVSLDSIIDMYPLTRNSQRTTWSALMVGELDH